MNASRNGPDIEEVGLLDDVSTYDDDVDVAKQESFRQFCHRQYQNVVHFVVEDWCLMAALGLIGAILSIFVDVAIEYLISWRNYVYDIAAEQHIYSAFSFWVFYLCASVLIAALFCHFIGKQAIGSGIPEIKVIMNGFAMKNYLSLRTLIAKIVGLIFTLGSGLPVGKEGPFVHMGAILASLLSDVTASCRYQAFFSNEGRRMEMLSSGCAVGIACTFSAPAGGVLYGIESTSRYFAVKNYWRSFFATTCAALTFRFVVSTLVPTHLAGTIVAYYQTNFPNEVFVIEEVPIFAFMGILLGLGGALFIYLHRSIAKFRKTNRACRSTFLKSPIAFTMACAVIISFITFPEGFGRFVAGKLTFREVLVDFIANCTLVPTSNMTDTACSPDMIGHWNGENHPLIALMTYLIVFFCLVALCISLYLPAGVFVPSFVLGACFGRIVGEIVAWIFPEGFRGLDGPQIYPGLYAVVGAAAYTGAVTHSLSIAVIVCETTGQLCALLPVLVALMLANAVSSFLQPSIYESIIKIKELPYLVDLPPSRISVHTMKVEKLMVTDLVYLTKNTTYRQLIDILQATPNLRSYPLVNDKISMALLGSVGRKYLIWLVEAKLGPEPSLQPAPTRQQGGGMFTSFKDLRPNSSSASLSSFLTDRSIVGSALLAHSPLHGEMQESRALAGLIETRNESVEAVHSLAKRSELLGCALEIDDMAIDPAPFQLCKGTSLYKVHTLFTLLALNHAYVTERGRLVGVVSLKELRETLSNIYTQGAVAPIRRSISNPLRNADSETPPTARHVAVDITVDDLL